MERDRERERETERDRERLKLEAIGIPESKSFSLTFTCVGKVVLFNMVVGKEMVVIDGCSGFLGGTQS